MPMPWQSLLLETQILARAVDGFMTPPAPPKRSPTAKVLEVLAVALVSLGLAALGVGAYLWLSETYPLRTVALIMGGGGIAIGLLFAGSAWAVANRRMLTRRVKEKVIRHRVQELAQAVTEEFGDVVRDYPKTAAAVAAFAGIALGDLASRNSNVKGLVRETRDYAARTLHNAAQKADDIIH